MDRVDTKHPLAALARRAFPSYRGRRFTVIVSDRARRLASYWDGGSRDTFAVVQGGQVICPPTWAPYGGEGAPDYVPVAGAVLVEHSFFMGKAFGCTIYLHPSDAAMV